ncbi:EAL domain-containing protein [Acuticoccus kandeliae]|uniref:EAL domain-containing protein n=1 Tax=Acuticoccus kandeliae TaxID=2073160 RepID=UPI000D3E500C|nr:EAL domain-containing protein [Acuticoccus kandeliae]
MNEEALFARAMADSAIGMALVGLDGGWLRVNDALCKILGYEPDELMKLTFQDITHPDDLDADLDLLAATLAGEISNYRLEKRYLHKDGRVLWALLVVSLVRDEANAPRFFISQIESIHSRKLAEIALAESETRLNFALESSGQGVWDRNFATGASFRSTAWYTMIGYAPGELSDEGEAWVQLVHPDDWHIVEAADRAAFAGSTDDTRSEIRLRHKDGHWIWISNFGRVMERAPDGTPVRMIGTHTDISERKMREEELRTANERVELAVEAGKVGIWEFDLATERARWDRRMYELYGIAPGSFDGTRQSWRTFVHPDDADRSAFIFPDAIRSGKRTRTDLRIVRGDGAVRHVRSIAQAVFDDAGQPTKLVGTLWDITDHKLLSDQLFEEKERLRITLHSIGDAVITTDADMKITFMNPIAEALTEWSYIDAEGRPLAEIFRIFDGETGLPIKSPIEECLTRLEPFYLQEGAVLHSKQGRTLNIQDSAAPVRTASGHIIGAVLVFQDVTRAHALQRELAHAALHDSLTGLPNRRSFERTLAALCDDVQGRAIRHSLCYLDLDRFKLVNDTAGHAAGDALLVEVGRLLRSCLREGDTLARIGGDEFAILLPQCPLQGGYDLCRRIVETIISYAFTWEGSRYDIGASVGVAEISGTHHDAVAVMKEADVACYTAKSEGRGKVSVYQRDRSAAERLHRQINIAATLRTAVESNRFTLFAQPIRDLRGAGEGQHVEILVRMLDLDGELIPPSEFIPAAERYGLMHQIDRWVLMTVFNDYAYQLNANTGLHVAINISANSLDDPYLWSFVRERMDHSHIDPSRISFEITETTIVNNTSSAVDFCRSAQRYGCRVTLDDFGVGLSSFSYLRNFRANEIKIDGSFVRNIATSEVDRQVVQAIVGVGRTFGIATIAEWVENAETLAIVESLGIDRAQGFFIGAPEPFENFLGQRFAATGL